ncbi:MAG: hypothetical protein M1286_02030 [Candidatus Marsarchaeota archaeon]|nr:hypothetical protein [Candidatus Marsarchaeota archaeon]
MEVLRCGCRVENGTFIVGDNCAYCKECNTVAELHPFGDMRLDELEGK